MLKNNLEIITLNMSGITDFASARNKLLQKAKSDWIFFVDSDEKVSPQLRNEVLEAIKKQDVQGYFVDRRDFIFGTELEHGEFSNYGWFGNSRLMRLARRGAGKWERSIHEIWKVKGKTGTLKNPLFHYPHPNLRAFINNINYFSDLHAIALKNEGKKSGLIKIIIWPVGKFVYNYFFRLGFIDGMVGFMVALMMSFHSYLAWSKLWILQKD